LTSDSSETCLVKVQAFEGPLDLLLHLIKKHEINIYDIPMALITQQYLEYLNMMKELNLEIVGDYLIIAAELGHIKSKMLLPKPDDDEEIEEDDPRADLVKKLIEYQRYQEAAEQLSRLETLERDVFTRVYEDGTAENAGQLLKVDLWSLIDSLREVFKRRNLNISAGIQFDIETVTLDERIREVTSILISKKKMKFEDLFRNNASRLELIITFLAILELIRTRLVSAYQEYPFGPIKLSYEGEPTSWKNNT
jgi:segregation and condensation protein A